MDEIVVRNLYKIFGPKPASVFPLLEKGLGKEQILAQTGHTVAINNASFTVRKGEIFVVMGLSGSGKSTLIRCLNRLVEPTRGEILIEGNDITKMGPAELREVRRKKLAMVFQRFGLFPHRTVLANVEYGLEIQGIDASTRRKKALEALELVGLKGWESSYPDALSGGMQQRVGLARALATGPELLLMDEAFSALDPLIRKQMQDELLRLQSRVKKTIVFITHDLDEALKIGDRIAIMKDGVIVQIDTPEGILQQPRNGYVAAFTQDVDRTKILTASSVMRNPDALVTSKDGPRVAIRKMQELGLSSVFVVGKERELRGLVTINACLQAVQEGKTQLEEILTTDFPTTSPDTPLRDLLPVAAQTKVPIAVVDERGTLLGIVVRASVLAGIMGQEVKGP
ncbi:MAG: glycine betaine/proline transport system ATP-binding protein [Bacillota bacterium]|jgi:glycine betaine/proline transport system ATP-binding protein|nr:glycine betaine/proline transport system ATP-binding protein [Bacillota bacterium]MDK2856297.1 glycine betaine/proline transport system ATP-binding protein [Bacillota bacterium]MDK2926017.1 glycine betaine/proline transport system ATP-binding protein [Bacillota bacterium]